MRAVRYVGAMLALAGCAGCQEDRDPDQGTSVGNPGKGTVSAARGDGLVSVEASTELVVVTFTPCEIDVESAEVFEGDVDLVQPDPWDIPGGTWCGVEAFFGEPVSVSGQGAEGGFFELSLEPEALALWFDPPLEMDGHDVAVELASPGWISAERLDLGEGVERFVEPTSDLGLLLTGVIREESAVYIDLDGDGRVGDGDRAAGPIATTTVPTGVRGGQEVDTANPDNLSGEDAGCGCDARGGPAPLATGWLLLVALLARRRSAKGGRDGDLAAGVDAGRVRR